MCLWVRKKYEIFFCTLEVTEERSSQRYGSADSDPDPHQNVKDPQHCAKLICFSLLLCNAGRILGSPGRKILPYFRYNDLSTIQNNSL
jgi:hypothetical protein